jgi:hypothetical protein
MSSESQSVFWTSCRPPKVKFVLRLSKSIHSLPGAHSAGDAPFLFSDFSRVAITCDDLLIGICHNRSAAASPEWHDATRCNLVRLGSGTGKAFDGTIPGDAADDGTITGTRKTNVVFASTVGRVGESAILPGYEAGAYEPPTTNRVGFTK